MASRDPQVQAHLEWLGFVQPTERDGVSKPPPPGLVFSATALVRAGAIVPRSDAEGQRALRRCGEATDGVITDFPAFARAVLGWSFSAKGYAGTEAEWLPEELAVTLPDVGETLAPDFAVRERDPAPGAPAWQLLVGVLETSHDLDRPERGGGQLEASAHGRMERLLRETGVPAGLLVNGHVLRLISAPRGESSGWLEFRVADMTETAGRPILAALRLLLNERRLLTLPPGQRLAALLADSRRYQNEVSVALAEQVLHALYELLRGLQAADGAAGGELLREPLREEPDAIYHALLTVILRMLFVLYAEEREMLPDDEAFVRFYSLAGLYERLREDAARHPDTMDQRFGAWAQLLVLFRMVHDGAGAAGLRMPPRHGGPVDPDSYPFIEGRMGRRQGGERVEPPLVPDGTVLRALEKLLVLDGERLSYRALDVEQIGSVYETMMGFRLERATGRSLAIKAAKRHGAPTAVDLDALLAQPPEQRAKRLAERADRKVPAGVAAAVRGAETVEELHAGLLRVADRVATPDLVPAGALVLQPNEERRRSGSHYTPRSLTAPIVSTTLAPVLERLREPGAPPLPEAILDLKVCDPAIGSGAFLVEACRQLADALVEAWAAHGERPELPADEDEVVYARRLVAQRCLYGVDKNPVAVDLAKLSLWLVTLAREHAFTFLDHALRHGDSLVGLGRRQIEAFHWKPATEGFEAIRIREHVARAAALRAEIRAAGEEIADATLHGLWDDAQYELRQVRLAGDLAVLAFFSGAKAGERETKRTALADAVRDGRAEEHRWEVEARRAAEPPLAPFHWEVEFPEVFDRERPGFDAIVGNPPFMGGSKISSTGGRSYLDWLLNIHPGSHGNA
ncbi:MAG: Eco57I restriction-modification methylase domain-containing protein, partial [Solirubrobacteraceae bacterium]